MNNNHIPRVWFLRHRRHGSILNGVSSHKHFVFLTTDVWKTKEQRGKQIKCCLCFTLAKELFFFFFYREWQVYGKIEVLNVFALQWRKSFFFYSGRQVYGKIEVQNVFEGRNIPQTFSAIVVKDFLCGNGAQRAGWCVLLW